MDDYMHKPLSNLLLKKECFTLLLLLLFSLLFLSFSLSLSEQASSASPPPIITYQGKLLVNSSSATTTRSMGFLIYDAATVGNLVYTASGTLSSTTTIDITPVQGIFTVNLGDTGTNAISTSTFQNNHTLYLEVIVAGQVLTPRKRITSIPYAINSEYLMGIAATSTSSSTYIPHANEFGNFTFSGNSRSAGVGGGLIYLNPTSSIANGTMLGIAINNSERFRIDSAGGVFASGTLNLAGLATITGGFNAVASSTVGNDLTVSGDLLASSTLQSTGLATLYAGLISNASSTFRSNLHVTGNLSASSTITIGGSIIPGSNNSVDLGGYGNAFRSIYSSTTIFAQDINVAGTCTGCGGSASFNGFLTTPLYVTDGSTTSTIRSNFFAVATSSANNLGLFNVDSSGNVNVSGTITVSTNILPRLAASSTATSQTTSTVDSAGNVGQWTSIAIGADGLPVISYYDVSNTNLVVAKCGNAACTSGNTTTTVDSTGEVGQYTSLAIGTDGLPVISYYDLTNTALKVAKCGNVACSSGNTITTVDTGAASTGQYTSLAISADGLPIISYFNLTGGGIDVAKCGNAACSSGNTTTTVDSPGDLAYTSLAIGTDGLPVISYFATSLADLRVAKCGNAACSAGNTTTTVDSTGSVGHFSSLAIGTDGLPVISYYDATNASLKVVKCGNVACSSGNTTTAVDSPFDVGKWTSLAIGTDGLPVISYQDVSFSGLKVVKCGNVSCSSGNTASLVDAAGDIGYYTSLAIGADDLPVISYFDNTKTDLNVAKCADPGCTASTTSFGAITAGGDIGSVVQFFKNVYASRYWGRQFQIAAFDLAEDYSTADLTLQPGEIVAADTLSPGQVIRASASSTRVLGIVSTQPGLLLSDWLASDSTHKVPIALAGRVPVKVTSENGPINSGDELALSTTTPGAATKAVSGGAIVGFALEGYDQEGIGFIQVFVSLRQSLSITEVDGKLVLDKDLDLDGHSIINVKTIAARNNAWRIDEEGNLIAVVNTPHGGKELYTVQNVNAQEVILSGIGRLNNGRAEITFDPIDQAIIDDVAPLKITMTLREPAKGLYLAESSSKGFIAQELDNGTSGASFTWVAIARRRTSPTSESDNADSPPTRGSESGSEASETPETSALAEEPITAEDSEKPRPTSPRLPDSEAQADGGQDDGELDGGQAASEEPPVEAETAEITEANETPIETQGTPGSP